MKNDSLKGQYRINEQIRAKEVRIVGDEVEPNVYPIARGNLSKRATPCLSNR